MTLILQFTDDVLFQRQSSYTLQMTDVLLWECLITWLV